MPDEGSDEEEISDIAVVIDNGSGMIKAGLSSDEAPSCVFANMTGKPRKVWKSSMDKELYCGDEIEAHRSKLTIKYPIENGIIEDFDLMQEIWDYTFMEKLKVNPTEHPLLLTEPPHNPKPNREKMVEIMFEAFAVPTLNISIQGVLALLGQGRTTGLVLDVGEGVTHTIPVYEGYGFGHCIQRLDMAGRELNTVLSKLLAIEGMCLTTSQDQHEVRVMKEQYCYVAQDPSSEYADQVSHTLPDGRVISLGDERWRCPEALFNPSMIGLECATSGGVAGLVWESISNCAVDIRRTLLSNVILSGGSTMFPGFSERLTKELRSYAPTATQASIRIVQSKEQQFAVWSGAQVFASLKSMQEEQWMTYEDWEEYGAAFIHDKILVKYN